uniref:Uncharacterized protein n=1 Tax=Anguilla anguilla TaxID=7936 RepID=A0A0E9TMG3_ANGAN
MAAFFGVLYFTLLWWSKYQVYGLTYLSR